MGLGILLQSMTPFVVASIMCSCWGFNSVSQSKETAAGYAFDMRLHDSGGRKASDGRPCNTLNQFFASFQPCKGTAQKLKERKSNSFFAEDNKNTRAIFEPQTMAHGCNCLVIALYYKHRYTQRFLHVNDGLS